MFVWIPEKKFKGEPLLSRKWKNNDNKNNNSHNDFSTEILKEIGLHSFAGVLNRI